MPEQHPHFIALVKQLHPPGLYLPSHRVRGWKISLGLQYRRFIPQGLRKGADSKVLKENGIITVGPSSAAHIENRLLVHLDLPLNISGPSAKPRIAVARCKPCGNPFDADETLLYLPASPMQCALSAFTAM